MPEPDKTWVEFHGGPYDGTMTEIAEPFDGMLVYEPRERQPDGTYRVGKVRGRYARGGIAVEGLEVVRMDWSHRVPDDLKGMEDRRVSPPKQ